MGDNLEEAEKRILGTLLADFADRQLGPKNLSNGYEVSIRIGSATKSFT